MGYEAREPGRIAAAGLSTMVTSLATYRPPSGHRAGTALEHGANQRRGCSHASHGTRSTGTFEGASVGQGG
jgi:hypothetical protein